MFCVFSASLQHKFFKCRFFYTHGAAPPVFVLMNPLAIFCPRSCQDILLYTNAYRPWELENIQNSSASHKVHMFNVQTLFMDENKLCLYFVVLLTGSLCCSLFQILKLCCCDCDFVQIEHETIKYSYLSDTLDHSPRPHPLATPI
jgi:hypothetical protein